MEVLLTGSNGFLGNYLSDKLSNYCTVYSLSRIKATYNYSLDENTPVFDRSFDLIIHAAGKAHSVPKTAIEKSEFHKVNVLGTSNLLKGLENTVLPKQFVFISSVSVYGLEEGLNITEEFPLDAKDPYGLSKIEAEELVQKWCIQNNVVCTILRLPLVVGVNPPGNLGSMLKALNKGYYFNIGGGNARKSMVLARDVAAFISVVAPVGGVYNLTDGYHPSFRELSSAIMINSKKGKPINLPLKIAQIVGVFGDIFGLKFPINSKKISKITTNLTFDDSKARKRLNWAPQLVIDYVSNNNLIK